MCILRAHFPPEFLNRVDDIVMFHRLTRKQIKEIVGIQMKHVSKRLAEKNISIVITPPVSDFLVEHGYDPAYGARPLKRAIQRFILDPMAINIIEGRICEGCVVTLDIDKNGIRFQRRNTSAA